MFVHFSLVRTKTPWKINMEHTNHTFRKENDLPNLQGVMFQPLIFQGETIQKQQKNNPHFWGAAFPASELVAKGPAVVYAIRRPGWGAWAALDGLLGLGYVVIFISPLYMAIYVWKGNDRYLGNSKRKAWLWTTYPSPGMIPPFFSGCFFNAGWFLEVWYVVCRALGRWRVSQQLGNLFFPLF